MVRIGDLQGIQDGIYLGTLRNPEIKIYLYDNTDTFSDIVLGRNTQVPMNITDNVLEFSISESDDAATTCDLIVLDNHFENKLSPYNFIGNKIIKILYKDENIQNQDYITLFIGPAVGQPGYRRNRESSEKIIDVSCVDRSFFYNKQNRTVNTSPYPQNTDLGDIAIDIATNTSYGMGLDRTECRFGLFRKIVNHTQVSIYDVPYMEGLSFLGFINGLRPSWDNDGYLVYLDTSIDKNPVRKYKDELLFLDISWPKTRVDINNTVEIIGLSNILEKISSPTQELATIRGTIGYFEQQYKTRVYYTQDRQGRAENIFISDYNLNGQLLGKILGGKPRLEQVGEFSCVLVIDTPYQSWVFVAFFGVYISFFVVGSIFGGLVNDIMLLAAALWLAAGLIVMQQMGTFEVTISGSPYKLVYREIKGVAQIANINDYEERKLTIENHLVDSQDLADQIAKRELKKELTKSMQRNLKLPFDPFLAKSDIIELPDGTRYYISSISKKFKRNESQEMDLTCNVVRSGKEYNNNSGFSEY